MKYKVIVESDHEAFEQAVNDALGEGWRLQGGVAYTAYFAHWHNAREGYEESEDRQAYAQALIKTDGAP